jgi:hypothetical protein
VAGSREKVQVLGLGPSYGALWLFLGRNPGAGGGDDPALIDDSAEAIQAGVLVAGVRRSIRRKV